MLERLTRSRTAPRREVERARVLLAYAQGQFPTQIRRSTGLSRPTIYKCIDKALAGGVAAGLRDRFHRPHAPQINDGARAWMVDLACRKPKDLGYAAESWTLSALAAYVRTHVQGAGFERLACAGKTTAWRILAAHTSGPAGCAAASSAATLTSRAGGPKC